MTTVSQHLSVAGKNRDLDWIKKALQFAVELEHSTLPLYLSGMFSLETQNYTTYNLIRSVVMEEMVHMAIACNILSAIGGRPEIKNINPGFPRKGLPGNAEPDLQAVLAKLSKNQLENYLRVEMPDFLLPEEYRKEEYPTIGSMYNSILKAIEANADEIRNAVKSGGSSNQVGDDIGFTTITYSPGQDPLKDIISGIHEILDQGEGAISRTMHAGIASESEPSHYTRFAEIYYGHRYQQVHPPSKLSRENVASFFSGYEVPFPEVVNVLMVPKDGYESLLNKDPDGKKVRKNIQAFDDTYTAIMNALELMWNGPKETEWPTFGKAVGLMTELRVLSCFNIIRSEIPSKLITNLASLYPDEYDEMAVYTDLTQPVFYGPRFFNTNVQST